MTSLTFLGTSAGIPDLNHENTSFVLRDAEGVILVDCSGSPLPRLQRAGVDPSEVSDIILTHFHPDHVGGLPLLLMNMWLAGRSEPLRIYGLHHCLKRVEEMMGAFYWENWPGFFPVAFHRLPEQESVVVLERGSIEILASPVRHVIPTIGLRILENRNPVLAYSCDTEPCAEVVRLAAGSPVLIHEATGEEVGHSSAAQAGEIASESGVETLYLVHYLVGDLDEKRLENEAKATFDGSVVVARDWMRVEL